MKKYLVVGNPINHSLSPKLHNYWIKNNNIDAIYERQKIDEAELKNLIFEIKKRRIDGANVTVPFKKKIIPHLDILSPEANDTQSVNTIYLKDNKVIGHNTDIYGFESAIKNFRFDVSGKKVFILGAGGVVPSLIFALKNMKALEIVVANRTKAKAEHLKVLFKNIKVVNWGEIPDFDMIINATSIGLNKDDELNLDLKKVGNKKFFYDVIYSPSETNFLKNAKNQGNTSENGKLMFVYQALAAFKVWHGIQPEINDETLKLLDL